MLDSVDTLIAFVLIMLVVSLLITIAVQMASAALNLRGVNLAQGLKRAFAVIDPRIDAQAKQLANYILKGRYLSDSFLPDWPIFRWWRHAEAVRPREAFDAIQRIALGKEPANYISTWEFIKSLWKTTPASAPAEAATTTQTKTSLGQHIKAFWKGKSGIDLQAKAVGILKGLGIPNEKITAAQGKIRDTTEEGLATLKEFSDVAETAYDNFSYWTCTCQERAQQWVTMHSRILTIVFAFLAAFWLQLDTVEIFKLVSSNKAVRDKLVAQAGAVEAQAAKILGDSNTVLKDALKAWSKKQTDPAITNLLAGIEIKDTDTRESVRDKTASALKDKTPVDTFDGIVNATATQRLKEEAGNFNTVKADFEKTGFDLFPRDSAFRWGKNRWDGFNEHWIGMLFSVGLLSLGAPFWYNSLKNLVSLRSQVAQNISAEQKEAEKQPDKPKQPPPTVTPLT